MEEISESLSSDIRLDCSGLHPWESLKPPGTKLAQTLREIVSVTCELLPSAAQNTLIVQNDLMHESKANSARPNTLRKSEK